MAQLVVLHQEDFERRLAQNKWSVIHASNERWVGKDAGMRELIKLTRVSTAYQVATSVIAEDLDRYPNRGNP
jgi:F-box/leucine-rich repeat protein 2/20